MLNNNSQAKKPHELYIMPNTGHHYYFIPFSEQFKKQHGIQSSDLLKTWKGESRPWQGVPKKPYDPQAPEANNKENQDRYTWMRYRFGYKGAKQNIGLWLAIESNLGTVKRGTLFEEREIAARDMPANQAEHEVSPYAYPNHAAIGRSSQQGTLKEVKDAYAIILPVELPDGKVVPFERVDIIWQNNNNVMDVDLIVDFGNTRTVVLALENNRLLGAKGQFNYLCKEINFLPRGQEYTRPSKKNENRGETIADSWFLLQQPMFAEWDYPSPDGSNTSFFTSKQYTKSVINPPENDGGIMQHVFGGNKPEPQISYHCTQRVPQMFVEISPALMGEEAKRLMNNIDMERGLHVSMSSPKRYLWDRGNSPHSWHINFNSWSNISDRSSLPSLQGQICRYMYSDGEDWDIDHPPFKNKDLNQRPLIIPQRATYPRSTAMMWSALSIIESAYRQITSYNWRAGDGGSVARRLRSINVTFPSGWIAKERQYYRQAWQQAVNIFTLAHMNTTQLVTRESATDEEELHKQGRPELYVDLDEAVASQLPFIYSEISRLKDADLWIELYGRKASEACGDSNSRVRVMTIDIGGGTLDTAIVEYYNDAPKGEISLRYKVLFRDSNTFAGDNVTLAIIQRVLLKSFLNARGIPPNANNEVASNFMQTLSDPNRKESDRARWQRIVTLLFLPIVRQWLSDVANYPSGYYQGENGRFRSIEECGGDETAINEFNQYLMEHDLDADFVKGSDRLEYDPDEINACIEETLSPGIEPLGQFTAAYDVDVVTVSGKISEMPRVEALLRRYLPVSPQCIVRMKDYLAGSWYPMSKNNRINDAKTVTAVGAALYKAGNGLLGNYWDCREDDSTIQSSPHRCRNYWGTMRPDDSPSGFNEILLTPNETDNSNRTFTEKGKEYKGTKMKIRSCIGRQKYHTQTTVPQRLYRLCWTGPESHFNNGWILAVVVERVSSSDAVANGDSYAVDEDDIKLKSVKLCNPSSKGEHFDPDKVELQLCTLPDEGFWMEECRFFMDI